MFGLILKSKVRAYIDDEIEYWSEMAAADSTPNGAAAAGIVVSMDAMRMEFFGEHAPGMPNVIHPAARTMHVARAREQIVGGSLPTEDTS
jgi:hypothetical protein